MVNLIWVRFIKAFSWEKSSDRALVDQSLCSQYVSRTTAVKHHFAHNLDSLVIILFQYLNIFFAGSRVVNLFWWHHINTVFIENFYTSITQSLPKKMILLCTCMIAYCVYGNHTIAIGNFHQGGIVNYSQGINFFHLTGVHTLSSSIPWAWFPQKDYSTYLDFLQGSQWEERVLLPKPMPFCPKYPTSSSEHS